MAVGLPFAGRLVRGVQLPVEGQDYVTWDSVLKRRPNRPWRRWGTDRLVRVLLRVGAEYHRLHPDAPPLLIGDLSRPRGGDFGVRFGGTGHASHQNGLDADVYYPRKDGRLTDPRWPSRMDKRLSRDLLRLFVRAGAQKVFVGFKTGLRGPRRVVVPYQKHDNHMHVRLRPAARKSGQ